MSQNNNSAFGASATELESAFARILAAPAPQRAEALNRLTIEQLDQRVQAAREFAALDALSLAFAYGLDNQAAVTAATDFMRTLNARIDASLAGGAA